MAKAKIEVINDLLGYEGLKIIQRPDIFNFSLDSTILADFVTINKSDKKIIDLGCGNGYIPIFLTLRTKAKITGIDCSKVAIKGAKKGHYKLDTTEIDYLTLYHPDAGDYQKRAQEEFAKNFKWNRTEQPIYDKKKMHLLNCDFRQEDVSNIGDLFEKNSQDLILCRYVLYHIPNIEELYNVFGQFEKILKPGGLLCLNDIEAKYYKEALLTLGFIQPHKNYPWIFEKPKTRKDKLNDFINSIENFINKGVNKK